MLHEAVGQIISDRRKTADKPDDLLTMLLSAHDQATGDDRPTKLVTDEVLTLLAAGHENVGAALVWSLYLLATHPRVQEDLYDQIRGRLRGADPGAEDLDHLPLARAVFEESMRLYPPGWGELRESIGPDEINGCDVPQKALILLCQWVTHRHPDFWEDAASFKPERFMSEAAWHRFAYFPFGGGPRICIGTQFALMEGTLVLGTILQRFRVRPASTGEVQPDATFVLRPRGGLNLIFEKR